MAEVMFSVPWPPSLNHYWRHVGNRVLISRAGRQYRREVMSVLECQRPMEGPLRVHVEAWPPDARRRDLDNILKALLDALEHAGIYRDDSQIENLEVERRPPVAGGSVWVTVRSL